MGTLLKKLTLRTMNIDKAAINEAIKAANAADIAKGGVGGLTIELATIVGVSTEARPGQTEMGSFLKLVGTFAGVNKITGEAFDSGMCILPEFISSQLGAAIAENGEVEFAVTLAAKENAKSAVGYEFVARPLMEAAPSDKMAKLLALAGTAPAALENKPTQTHGLDENAKSDEPQPKAQAKKK